MSTFRLVNFIAVTFLSIRFVFPVVIRSDRVFEYNFDPHIVLTSKCKHSICFDIPGYPKTYIRDLLEKNNTLKLFSGSDEVVQAKAISGGNDDDLSLCPVDARLYYPKAAKNDQHQWKYILNSVDDFRQGIRVDFCRNPNKSSNLDLIDEQYNMKTICKQDFGYRQLLALDYDGEPVVDLFWIPTDCICVLNV